MPRAYKKRGKAQTEIEIVQGVVEIVDTQEYLAYQSSIVKEAQTMLAESLTLCGKAIKQAQSALFNAKGEPNEEVPVPTKLIAVRILTEMPARLQRFVFSAVDEPMKMTSRLIKINQRLAELQTYKENTKPKGRAALEVPEKQEDSPEGEADDNEEPEEEDEADFAGDLAEFSA